MEFVLEDSFDGCFQAALMLRLRHILKMPRSHFIGCGWYAIGMEGFDPQDRRKNPGTSGTIRIR